MKKVFRITVPVLFIFLIVSCKKDKLTLPILTTNVVSSITQTTAISGGNISNVGGSSITSRGVCWSTDQNPTTNSSHTSDGSEVGNFSSEIGGLTPSTNYFVKAYATNSFGTAYGTALKFITSSATIPNLNTKSVSSITFNSAISGGDIGSEGGAPITAKGVCWSSTSNPTITNAKTNEGPGNTSFVSAMVGLQMGTVYYVKSYATNSLGTAYGNELSFETNAKSPELTTTQVSNINSRTAVSGGTIISDGGRPVISKGVMYSTNSTPVNYYPPNSLQTSDGTGNGPFISTMSRLFPKTKYYIRAYAENSIGMAWGNILSFTTLVGIPVVVTTNFSFLADGTITSGFIAHDGGSALISRGVCWSKNPNPTILDNITSDGSSTGLYTSILLGLQSGSTYYVRAYATNGQGTEYGQQISVQNLTLPIAVKDADGNPYPVLKIGEQYWLGENLKVTKYNDGTSIPIVQDNSAWQSVTTGAYCWYNNSQTTGSFYGALYNYYTVSTNKICPIGWHVPSSSEWNVLSKYLLDNEYGLTECANYIGKSVSSKTSWSNWNNQLYTPGYLPESSGFSGLAGGVRTQSGSFDESGKLGYWWTTTLYGDDVWISGLNYSSPGFMTSGPVSGVSYSKNGGLSIRCIKD